MPARRRARRLVSWSCSRGPRRGPRSSWQRWGLALALALPLTVGLPGCRRDQQGDDRCAYWLTKLEAGEQAQVAIARLGEHGCTDARGSLVARMKDEVLASDAFDALVALGRSPEAERAVVEALTRPATAARAAALALEWELAAASEEALRSAILDPQLGSARDALLDAGLGLLGPAKLAPELARIVRATLTRAEAGEGAAARARRARRVAAALATVSPGELGPAADEVGAALADFAARSDLGPDDEAGRAALRALDALLRGGASGEAVARAVAPRAAKGEPVARALLWRVDPPQAGRVALGLVRSAEPGGALRIAAAAEARAVGDEALDQALREALDRSDHAAQLLPLTLTRAALPSGERVALERRLREVVAEGKGEQRAAAAASLAVLSRGAELETLARALGSHPSALVREVVEGRWFRAARALDAAPPFGGLKDACAGIPAARTKARQAEQAASEAVAKLREEAKALRGGGHQAEDAAGAARLAALRAARDAAYGQARAAGAALDGLLDVRARAVLALARATSAQAPALANEALRAVRGPACGVVRRWAVARLVDAPAEERARAREALDAEALALGFTLGR